MAVQHAQFLVRHGFLNPHHAIAGRLDLFDKRLAFVGKFDGIGRTRTEHHLGALVNLRNRLNKLAYALLARNTAHEQDVRAVCVHAPFLENPRVKRRRVKIRIDTVVDDLHAVLGHTVKFHHVALHALAHRDYAVGGLVSGTFDPAAHGITAVTELFRLPRAVRFKRVRREDQRTLQQAARQHATEVAVPRMAMYYVNVLESRCPLEVDIERLENLLEALVGRAQSQLARKAKRTDVVFVDVLHAKTARLDMAKLCKFLRQELHVNTGTAVNFRGKLVSKNCCVHDTQKIDLFSKKSTPA